MKDLTAEQIKQKIRAQIKADNYKGLWWNFWRNIEINSFV